MICQYCGREHDASILCRGVSRRAFFFFGAAAAAAPFVSVPPVESDRFVIGQDIWQVLKNHPGIIDRVKFEPSYAGAIKGNSLAAAEGEILSARLDPYTWDQA